MRRDHKNLALIKKEILKLDLLAFQKLNPLIFNRYYGDLHLIERDPKTMEKVLKDLDLRKSGPNFYTYFLNLPKVETPLILSLLAHPKSIQISSLDLEVLLTKHKFSQKLFSWREKSVLGHFLLRYNPDEPLLSCLLYTSPSPRD